MVRIRKLTIVSYAVPFWGKIMSGKPISHD